MTLTTIIVNNPSDPVEVQVWLNQNQGSIIHSFQVVGNTFYILRD